MYKSPVETMVATSARWLEYDKTVVNNTLRLDSTGNKK